MIALQSLRYGVDELLEYVVARSDEYAALGYAEEMEYWKWRLQNRADNESEEKEETSPSLLVIHPSGFTDVIDFLISPEDLAKGCFDSVRAMVLST